MPNTLPDLLALWAERYPAELIRLPDVTPWYRLPFHDPDDICPESEWGSGIGMGEERLIIAQARYCIARAGYCHNEGIDTSSERYAAWTLNTSERYEAQSESLPACLIRLRLILPNDDAR